MRQRRLMVLGIAFFLLPFSDCVFQKIQAASISDITDSTESPPLIPDQEQPEVLTRGPVHEAFAEPITLQTDEGLVTVKQPPASINEILPNEKPAGANFIWVSGYWSWDGDRNNYIWVSGCWRIAPPKMSWVPGYWTRVTTGWKWVSGFWMQSGNNEIVYLKEPPVTLEIEPVGLPPTEYSIWVPGCWYWINDRYVSRSGYWLQGQAGWVWSPSHYVWTPRGYVFSNGHWDYTLERRGVLYAPVYFPSSVVYTRPGYRYSLAVTVDLGLLNVNRWHSKDPRWDEHARNSYDLRHNDRDLRPSITYHDQKSRMSKMPENKRDNFQIVRSGNSASSEKSVSRRFEQTDNDTQQKFSKQSNDVQNYREERRQWESAYTSSKGAKASADNHDSSGRSDRVRIPDSPVSDRNSSYTRGDRYSSTPSEERRGQDYGGRGDSRSSNGQRNGNR